MASQKMSSTPIKLLEPAEGLVAKPGDQDEASGVMLKIVDHLSGLIPLDMAVTASPPRLPQDFLLGALRDGRLRVRKPFSVKLTTENDAFIAEATEVDEFGFGENPSEAIVDLQRTIAELFFSLSQDQERLGPGLRRVWSTLQAKVFLAA